MSRAFVCLSLSFAYSFGQVPEKDTLSSSDMMIESLLEDVDDKSGESQVLDILEDMWGDLLDLSNRPNVRIRTRMQTERPFSMVRDPLGSPLKVYQRVLFEFRENEGDGVGLEGGIVTKKDAGERFSDSFAAGYLELTVPAMNGRLIVGDYAVESGKGLAFWRSSGITRGNDLLGLGKSKETKIEPYRSTDENHFFRGIAVEKNVGWLQLKAFFSDNRLSGSRNVTGVVTSLDTDGLFRTESELENRRVVREVILGGALSVNPMDGFTATVKGARISLGAPLSLTRYSAFYGTNADVAAADFIWKIGNLVASGEAATDRRGSVAISSSLLVEPAGILGLVLDARTYPRSFNNLHGFAFSEGGIVEGESGMCLGASIRPSRRLNASFFYDTYVFSNRLFFKSGGNDFLAKGGLRFDDGWEVLAQYRRLCKPALVHMDQGGLDHLHLGRVVQERYRLSILHAVSGALKWQVRAETTLRFPEKGSTERGYLVFQEMRWQTLPTLRVSLRIVAFQTDNYDTRIYTYEPDVPGGFSNLPLWKSGLRTYLLLEWSLAQNVRISAKYSSLHREHIAAEADGENERERITVQCDLAF